MDSVYSHLGEDAVDYFNENVHSLRNGCTVKAERATKQSIKCKPFI